MRISDWSSDVCSSDLTGGFLGLVESVEQIPELADVVCGIRAIQADIGQGVTRPTLGGALQQGFKFVMGHDHHAIHQVGFVHLLSFQIGAALLSTLPSALCTAGCSATQVISTCSPRGRTAITRASKLHCSAIP